MIQWCWSLAGLPIGVWQHWLSPLLDGLRDLVAEGAGEHGALACSSVVPPKKLARSAGNGSMSPRSLPRSSHVCFLARPWDKHSGAEPGGEQGHLAACLLGSQC